MRRFNIFLPVRNGENFISECIESILGQSHSFFHLYILDNNSTDNTITIAESFNDNRVTIIKSQTDLSIEENWFRILQYVTDDFMTIIGHDDILLPNFLDLINQLIELHPSASLYITKFSLIDSSGNVRRQGVQKVGLNNLDQFLQQILELRLDSFGTGYVFRGSDYRRCSGIPLFNKLIFADDALFLSLTKLGSLIVSNDFGFSYRQHNCSTSGSASLSVVSEALVSFINYLKNHLSSDLTSTTSVKNKFRRYILYWCTWLSLKDLFKTKSLCNSNNAANVYTACDLNFPGLLPSSRYKLKILDVAFFCLKYAELKIKRSLL